MSLQTTDIARASKIVWLVTCAAVLLAFLMWKGDAEAQRFLTRTMLVLCFPLGLLAIPFVIATGFLAQMISPLGSLMIRFGDYVMVWFWLFVFGYVQWFWLVPGVVRLVKKWRLRSRSRDLHQG